MMGANDSGGMSSTTLFESQAKRVVQSSDEQVLLRNQRGAECTATVKCESFSAIAVAIDTEEFNVGDSVDVKYGRSAIAGTVRRIDEQDDGTWILVVRWKRRQ